MEPELALRNGLKAIPRLEGKHSGWDVELITTVGPGPKKFWQSVRKEVMRNDLP